MGKFGKSSSVVVLNLLGVPWPLGYAEENSFLCVLSVLLSGERAGVHRPHCAWPVAVFEQELAENAE
jgi:hypothetical protein